MLLVRTISPTTHARLFILSCFLIGILLSVAQAAPHLFTARCHTYSLGSQEEFDELSLKTALSVTQDAEESFISELDASILYDSQPFDDSSLQTWLLEAQITPPPFMAYHNANSDTHQVVFDILSPEGWRMISLSVYGDMSNQLYAAVWVKPAVAPAWRAIHGATGAQYQAFFNGCAAVNHHPILLTAAGVGSQTVFAGTCEARPGPIPLTRFGLISGVASDVSTIEHWNQEAHTRGWILTSGAIYGTLESPRFAGIWSRNAGAVKWNSGVQDTSGGYQARFNAEVTAGYRPSFVTLSSYDRYLSVFVNSTIGPWIARHGLTGPQYVDEFQTRRAEGFYPFMLQGGGFGANARYAVLFAKNPV